MFLKMTLKPLKVTGCEEFPEGNFLNWENTNWFLNSSRGTVELSKLSFDALYYHLYPFFILKCFSIRVWVPERDKRLVVRIFG